MLKKRPVIRAPIIAALAVGLVAVVGAVYVVHPAVASAPAAAAVSRVPLTSSVPGRHVLRLTRVDACADSCKAKYRCADVAEPDQEKCIQLEVECILRCDPQPSAPPPPDDPDPNRSASRV
jgi:hypothetical protein